MYDDDDDVGINSENQNNWWESLGRATKIASKKKKMALKTKTR